MRELHPSLREVSAPHRLMLASLGAMVTPVVALPNDATRSSWALGWQVFPSADGPTIAHGGNAKGFHAFAGASGSAAALDGASIAGHVIQGDTSSVCLRFQRPHVEGRPKCPSDRPLRRWRLLPFAEQRHHGRYTHSHRWRAPSLGTETSRRDRQDHPEPARESSSEGCGRKGGTAVPQPCRQHARGRGAAAAPRSQEEVVHHPRDFVHTPTDRRGVDGVTCWCRGAECRSEP